MQGTASLREMGGKAPDVSSVRNEVYTEYREEKLNIDAIKYETSINEHLQAFNRGKLQINIVDNLSF